MRRVGLACLAVGLLALTGCSLVSRATTAITNPSLAQLATVATFADAPTGFTFQKSGDAYAASENYSESLDYWSKSAGSPTSCLPIF